MDESLGPGEPIDEAVFDLIEDTRRYVLAREAEIFAIWDLTTSADAPLATFPLDAEGEADARKEFHRLVASDRREHLLPRILL